jgi:hypothetical protein
MRLLVLLSCLLAQMSFAAECLRPNEGPTLALHGRIEHRRDDSPPAAPGFAIYLNLKTPICVEARRYDGTVLKLPRVESIQLGISKLNKPLNHGSVVRLRGELWGPVSNPPDDRIIFAVAEVL